MNADPSLDATAQQALPPLPAPERLQDLLFDAARLGRDDMISALLQAGANIAAHDAKGYTALILATYHDHQSTAALLLDRGADVDQPDAGCGNTALMGVAFKGFGDLARQLLAAGADPHITNKAGQTALMMAALFGHADIVDALLERGADPRQQDGADNSALSVAAAQGNDAMNARLSGARQD